MRLNLDHVTCLKKRFLKEGNTFKGMTQEDKGKAKIKHERKKCNGK